MPERFDVGGVDGQFEITVLPGLRSNQSGNLHWLRVWCDGGGLPPTTTGCGQSSEYP